MSTNQMVFDEILRRRLRQGETAPDSGQGGEVRRPDDGADSSDPGTDGARESVLFADLDGQLLDANEEAGRVYGYTLAELRRLSIRDLQAPGAAEAVEAGMRDPKVDGGRVFHSVHRRKDGTVFPVEIGLRRMEVGELACVRLLVRDVTGPGTREAAMERLNRVSITVHAVNRALMHAHNREEVFAGTCRALVESGPFCLAGLGWLDPQTRTLRPVAEHGGVRDQLREIGAFAEDPLGEHDPAGRCIRENRPVVMDDGEGESRARFRREAAERSGLRAAVALPVRESDRGDGVLLIYSREEGFFGEDELALLAEAAANISLTLDKLGAAESSRWLAYVVEQAGVGVIITDPQANIEYVNPNFTRRTGYSLAEVRGLNPRMLASGETPRETFTRLWDALRAGREWSGEFKNRRKDGETYWDRTSITPLRDTEGRITHFLGISTDITERKAAWDKVREQTALLDVASDAILVHDLGGRIRYWNRAATTLYGMSAAEVLDREISGLELMDPVSFQEARETTMLRGTWSGEARHRTRDHRQVTVLSRWTLVRDGRGQPTAIFVINTDITERKELEAQFLRAQRLESVGQLASGIAHDLNNILAPIVMAAPLIRAEVQTPDARQLAEIIETNAIRGSEVVKQVLAFSRGQRGEREPLLSSVVMKEIIRIVHETFPKTITVKTAIPEDLWMIEGDTTQLHQVLMNLCVNARDAMADGGTLLLAGENVTVESAFAAKFPEAKPGPYVVWLVADTGAGIDPENLERIFEPFFTTKMSGKGTGLGLSTALGIVRHHGGFARVESQIGRGTQFRVYLPAHPEMTATVEEPATGEAPRGRGETILVVDDEESVRVMVRHVLERHGYRVCMAGEGSEAVVAFAQHVGEIQAVLTDLMMPLMDGTVLIAALSRMSPGIRILATTGVTDTTQAAAAMRLGASGVLRKPFAPGLLLHKIRELLDEG